MNAPSPQRRYHRQVALRQVAVTRAAAGAGLDAQTRAAA